MNSLEALGIAYRALIGHRVVVVLSRIDTIRSAVDAVAAQGRYISDRVQVTREVGVDRIEIGRRGGQVTFTFRKSKRPLAETADLVVIDEAGVMSDTQYAALTSNAREVVTR